MDGRRRLAAAIGTVRQQARQSPYCTAAVLAVDLDAGTATIAVPGPDGHTVKVPGVRYHSAVTPQVGRQVTYVLNGAEPFILSESGSIHDPIFTGRVVANSFHALPGANLLTPEAADGAPWAGWSAEGGTVTIEDTLTLTVPGATAARLISPSVVITQPGRHYTGWVDMPDAGINDRAWVGLAAFDADGGEVASWGEFVDVVRLPGSDLRRYPMPSANEELSEDAATLRMAISVAAGVAGALTITSAYLGTSPIFEGGAVDLGRTRIDQGGFRLDDEELLVPWTETVYDGPDEDHHDGFLELGGGNWTVRHRRVGKVAHVSCQGTIEGPSTLWDVPSSLLLPYPAATAALLHGYLIDLGTRYYPVEAILEPGDNVVRRVIHPTSANGGIVDHANPFTMTTGDQLRLAGSYEID